jgi:hypothetical protein
MGTLQTSRLARLARPSRTEPETEPAVGPEAGERCELCNAPIADRHRHLLEVSSRRLVCACRPCSLLFDREGAGAGRYKLIPERRLRLDGFAISDEIWDGLRIPVDMAFFFHSSAAGRVVAFYPGPMGPAESQLELGAWRDLEAANPVLAGMAQDVEALLVNRVGEARRHWLVPVDDCYGLVGLIRMHWRGLSGGREVWDRIDSYFDELDGRARSAAGRR